MWTGSSTMTMPQPDKAASVLLVEDELLISVFIAEELSAHGFAVHAVSNAMAALNYMNAGSQVDILFTDIDLPGGMDGSELAKQARKLRPDLPIVYASGRYSPS